MTVKEALKLDSAALNALKNELKNKMKESKLNAFVGFEEEGSGVPISLKDNIALKGWPLTCASDILKGYISPFSSTAAQRLLDAGFSLLGRTNMDEFAFGSSGESSFYGPTLNPLDTSRVPGGSSSGAAAAVAAGLSLAALGSDTGGSIRQPASFCGLIGFKPSYGRISRYGLAQYAGSLDCIGLITQDIDDCLLLYSTLAGKDEKDATSLDEDPALKEVDRPLKICVLDNLFALACPALQEALAAKITALKAAGHEIIHANLDESEQDLACYYVIASAEASTALGRYDGVRFGQRAKEVNSLNELYQKTRTQFFGENAKRRILLGTLMLSRFGYEQYFLQAQRARTALCTKYAKLFKNADLLLLPSAAGEAFGLNTKRDAKEAMIDDIFTIGANLAGLAAISLPAGKGENGLPLGMQLYAAPRAESILFAGARAFLD